MVADHLLPVWTIRPNWIDPVTERLAWLSDVRASPIGAEQVEGLRLSPRRSLEARYTPTDRERSFLSLSLHQLGTQEWMVPLWHDVARLSASASDGITTLSVDTTYREFVDDGMALLVGPDAFSCEAVRIDTVSDSAITLVDGTTRAWPAGTVIHPLRRAELEDGAAVAGLTSRVGSATLSFLLSGDNDIDAGEETLALYEDLPLLTLSPNWSRGLNIAHLNRAVTADFDLGRRATVDPAGRAFPTQQHNWLLNGRQQQHAFREFAYRLRGQQRPLWLPTFMRDMIVTQAADAGDTSLDVVKIGYGYVGGPASGREHILIRTPALQATRVDALGVAASPDDERLVLSEPLAHAVPVGTRIEFLDTARLEQDAIEIVHHGSSDGAAEVSVSFRAVSVERDGTAPGSLAIPETEMSDSACSDGGDDLTYLKFVLPDHIPGMPEGAPGNIMRANITIALYMNIPYFNGPSDPTAEYGIVDFHAVQLPGITDPDGNRLVCKDDGPFEQSIREMMGDDAYPDLPFIRITYIDNIIMFYPLVGSFGGTEEYVVECEIIGMESDWDGVDPLDVTCFQKNIGSPEVELEVTEDFPAFDAGIPYPDEFDPTPAVDRVRRWITLDSAA